MRYLAFIIIWFFAVYAAITVFGIFLALEAKSPYGAVFGFCEYALAHILIGDVDAMGYEIVAQWIIYVVMFIKASIALTISSVITGVQYAQSKNE